MTAPSVDIRSVLRDSGFFNAISEDLLRKIARISKVEAYGRGDLIFADGMPCTGMYVVATGAVKIYKIGLDGREHVLHVAEPGDTFGEAAIFLGSAGYPAYAGAVRASSVVFISKRGLLDLLGEERDLCFQVLGSLAAWTHRLVTKLEVLALKDASSRLAEYIVSHAKKLKSGETALSLTIPKQTLAAHLAMSSETLSRLLSRFEADGLIESEGRHIQVLSPEHLARVSDEGAQP